MPGLTGRQIAEKLATLPNSPVVMYMSGYNDDEVIHRGVRDLESRFLQKPFSAVQLRQKVAEVLRGTRAVTDPAGTSTPGL
jgi:CheY-like chemotaxis protein